MTHRTALWTFRSRVAQIGIAPTLNSIQHDARATARGAPTATDAWLAEDQWLAGFPGQWIENTGLSWWQNS